MLGLAVSQVNAQGYRVGVRSNDAVASGNNQVLGAIQLTHQSSSGARVHIPEADSITITYDGLTITNTADIVANAADTNSDIPADGTAVAHVVAAGGATIGTIAAANDKDTKAGKITIPVTTHGGTIVISGVRADVSGMSPGASIMVTVSTVGATSDFLEDDQGNESYTPTRAVSYLKDGLNVTAVKEISQLSCDPATSAGRMPEITVAEGFATAWETNSNGFAADADGASSDSTHIRIVVANTQSGVTFRWPGQDNFAADGTTPLATDDTGYFAPVPAHTHDHDEDDGATTADETVAQLVFVEAGAAIGDDKTKHWAVYRFEGTSTNANTGSINHDDAASTFKVSPMVMVDGSKVPEDGGVSDVWAQLWPMAKTGDNDDRATVLSYSHDVETKDNGYFVNLTQCVTYLLYPFLTCGATADWTTGIAIANTSADDEAFPVSGGATAQSGSVVIHAYPKSTAAEKMAMGNMSSPEMLADPISATLSGNLAAGDTIALTCNMHPMLAGFDGYGIVRAAFRHAHGMAFLLGNYMDGAAIDVAHGYTALVIPDPEFGTDRAPAAGETLGH
ncbi:MAG: hypothetical protein OXU26_01410 [Acidobacteriota bacterium]|nr:hypothetical protein [Acidobacteriota bacterium]